MEVFDYINDENGDLLMRNGDFVVGESTQKHQQDLLLANRGEYKQNPTIGVGLNNFLLNNDDASDFRQAVTKEFEADGMEVKRIDVNGFDDVEINAEYVSAEDNSSR